MDVNELPYRTLYLHAWLLLNSSKENLIAANPKRIGECAFWKGNVNVATFEVVDMLESLLKTGLIKQCKVNGEPFIEVIPVNGVGQTGSGAGSNVLLTEYQVERITDALCGVATGKVAVTKEHLTEIRKSLVNECLEVAKVMMSWPKEK